MVDVVFNSWWSECVGLITIDKTNRFFKNDEMYIQHICIQFVENEYI